MLTSEEEKEFTMLNCLAFDIARKNAKGTIPTWLTTADEYKAEYRKVALAFLNAKFRPPIAFDESNLSIVEIMLGKLLPAAALEKWKEVETEYKRLREEENSALAFFC